MNKLFILALGLFVLSVTFQQAEGSFQNTKTIQTPTLIDEKEVLDDKIQKENSIDAQEAEDNVDILDFPVEDIKEPSLKKGRKGSDRSAWGLVKRYANAVKNNIVNLPGTLSQEAHKMGTRTKKVGKVLSDNVNKIGSHVKEMVVGKTEQEKNEFQILNEKESETQQKQKTETEKEKESKTSSNIGETQKHSFTPNPFKNSSFALQNLLKTEERVYPVCLLTDAPKVQPKSFIQNSYNLFLEGGRKIGNVVTYIPKKVVSLFKSENKMENSIVETQQDICPRKQSQSLAVPVLHRQETSDKGDEGTPPALASTQVPEEEGGVFGYLKSFGRSLKFSPLNIIKHIENLAISGRNYTRNLFKSSNPNSRRPSNFTSYVDKSASLTPSIESQKESFFQDIWQDISQMAANFKKKNISTSFVKGIHRTGTRLQALSSNFTNGVRSMAGGLVEKISSTGKAIQSLYSKSSDRISGLMERIKRTDFSKIPEAISNKGSQLFEKFKKSLFFVGQVWKVFSRPYQFIRDGVTGIAGFLFDKITYLGKGVFDAVIWVGSGFKSAAWYIFDNVWSIAGSLANFFKSLGLGVSKYMSIALIILALSLLLVVLSYLKPIISPLFDVLSFGFSAFLTGLRCFFGCLSCLNRRRNQERTKENNSRKDKKHQHSKNSEESEHEEEERMKKGRSQHNKKRFPMCECSKCQDFKPEPKHSECECPRCQDLKYDQNHIECKCLRCQEDFKQRQKYFECECSRCQDFTHEYNRQKNNNQCCQHCTNNHHHLDSQVDSAHYKR